MDLQIWIGLLLSVLPIFELRGGLPLIVEYAARNGLNIWPFFVLVLLLNILVIFFIFFFLDFLHLHLMKLKFYRRWMEKYLNKIQKKSKKVQKKMDVWGYVALMLFVSIPLPGTGAWTGSFVAWVLNLNRLKSVVAISAGIVIAGFIVLFASLFGFSLLY